MYDNALSADPESGRRAQFNDQHPDVELFEGVTGVPGGIFDILQLGANQHCVRTDEE